MTTSRRAILGASAALAAGSAINIAAIIAKPQAAEPSANLPKVDPIFALIERHRTAYDAVEAAHWDDDGLTDAVSAVTKLYDELRFASPATAAGWAALLRYVVEREIDLGDCPEQLCSFCGRVAAVIERMAVPA